MLNLNQIDILHNSLFIKLLLMPFFANKVVSSLKRINWYNLLELWRSFTYIRNNNGPSIIIVLLLSELTLLKFTYCILFFK